MPTVSVIIPNYNHAPYLRERIDSVLNQTFQDFEVIILDDKSPDNSIEIIESYRNHPKVSHIVYNEENSGSTFKQWEKGISLSQGEWIWIAESDDWCEPYFLEKLLSGPLDGVSIAFAQTYLVNQHPTSWSAHYYSEDKDLDNTMDGRCFVEKKMIPYNGIWNASQAIFKKKKYYELSPKYLEFRYCGDWVFWIEMALTGKVFISGRFLSYFRKHDKDVTSKASKSGLRYLEEAKAIEYFDQLLSGYLTNNNFFYTHFIDVSKLRKGIPPGDYLLLKEFYHKRILRKYLVRQAVEKKILIGKKVCKLLLRGQ